MPAKITTPKAPPSFLSQYGPNGRTPMIRFADHGKDRRVLSSGLLTLDVLTGRGGFLGGSIVTLSGAPGVGKTAVLTRTAAEQIADGGIVMYIDTEGRYDPWVASANGLPWEEDLPPEQKHFYLVQYEPVDSRDVDADLKEAATFQSITALVRAFFLDDATRHVPKLVCIDSLNFILPEQKETKAPSSSDDEEGGGGGTGKGGGIALVPRLMSEWIPELSGYLLKYGAIAIFVQQFRARIATGPSASKGPAWQVSGPYALRYASSLNLQFEYIGKIAVDKNKDPEDLERLGDQIQITVTKNTGGFNHKRGVFKMLSDRGPDDISEIIHFGQAVGLVEARGAFYKFLLSSGEWSPSCQGQKQVWDYFYSSDALLVEMNILRHAIRAALLKLPEARKTANAGN